MHLCLLILNDRVFLFLDLCEVLKEFDEFSDIVHFFFYFDAQIFGGLNALVEALYELLLVSNFLQLKL